MRYCYLLILALVTFVTLVFSAGCGDSGANASDLPGLESSTVVRHVDADGAEALIADQAVVVIDVRTPKEFAKGHIPQALNLDFYTRDFKERVQELDRNQVYLVHCAVGGRSTQSLATFKELGFATVVHLDGGYKGWEKAGKSVTR